MKAVCHAATIPMIIMPNPSARTNDQDTAWLSLTSSVAQVKARGIAKVQVVVPFAILANDPGRSPRLLGGST
jgi:hypothetical protein